MDTAPIRNAETQPPLLEQRAIDSTNGYTLTCVVCGQGFVAARPQALYCSPRCKQAVLLRRRHDAGRVRRHRRCPRCGNIFVARRADGVYCSNACRQAMHRRRHRAEG
jgi:predicted nucleic acid-binding Zn ribbon protein